MYFIDQRIQVICNQLGNFRFRECVSLPDWEYKKGQFFRPEEADRAAPPWERFDCQSMRWYADYAGTDQFEGKFQGQHTDFHGIPLLVPQPDRHPGALRREVRVVPHPHPDRGMG